MVPWIIETKSLPHKLHWAYICIYMSFGSISSIFTPFFFKVNDTNTFRWAYPSTSIPWGTNNLSISFGDISPTQSHHHQSYSQSALLNSRRKRSRLNYNPDTSHTYISHIAICFTIAATVNALIGSIWICKHSWQALCNLNSFALPPIQNR